MRPHKTNSHRISKENNQDYCSVSVSLNIKYITVVPHIIGRREIPFQISMMFPPSIPNNTTPSLHCLPCIRMEVYEYFQFFSV